MIVWDRLHPSGPLPRGSSQQRVRVGWLSFSRTWYKLVWESSGYVVKKMRSEARETGNKFTFSAATSSGREMVRQLLPSYRRASAGTCV